jgi:hypothetical protein
MKKIFLVLMMGIVALTGCNNHEDNDNNNNNGIGGNESIIGKWICVAEYSYEYFVDGKWVEDGEWVLKWSKDEDNEYSFICIFTKDDVTIENGAISDYSYNTQKQELIIWGQVNRVYKLTSTELEFGTNSYKMLFRRVDLINNSSALIGTWKLVSAMSDGIIDRIVGDNYLDIKIDGTFREYTSTSTDVFVDGDWTVSDGKLSIIYTGELGDILGPISYYIIQLNSSHLTLYGARYGFLENYVKVTN